MNRDPIFPSPISDEAWLKQAAIGAREVLAAYAATDIDTRFLRSPKFVDLTGRRDRQKCYVDPIGDFRDAFLMTEWTRESRHRKGFGRGYQRLQFCRAFCGCSAADIREAGEA